MQQYPGQIIEMVRKLYVLEHATPKLYIPELFVIKDKEGNLIIDYAGPARLFIGDELYNLDYTVDISSRVTMGYEPEKTIPPGYWIAGGVGLFAGGLVLGLVMQ